MISPELRAMSANENNLNKGETSRSTSVPNVIGTFEAAGPDVTTRIDVLRLGSGIGRGSAMVQWNFF